MPIAARFVANTNVRIPSCKVSVPGEETIFSRPPAPRSQPPPNAKSNPSESPWPDGGCSVENLPRPFRLFTARLLLTSTTHFPKYC